MVTSPVPVTVPDRAPPHYPDPQYAEVMGTRQTSPTNTAAFAHSTGIAWTEWVRLLDDWGAMDRPHPQIARYAAATIRERGQVENPDWWAQSVALAYEQHIGRRVPGQRADGSFEASASRTVTGTLEEALTALSARLSELIEHDGGLAGTAVTTGPSTSATDSWRYWSASLVDGSRVSATIGAAPPSKNATALSPPKVRVGVGHARLGSAEAAQRWKSWWKDVLGSLPADVRTDVRPEK